MTSILFPEITAKRLLALAFITLLINSFFLVPYEDSYYYWEWSRHLGLSYFDGPPFIAYLMRIFTALFGNTIYAINLLGVASIALTAWLIYKTSEMLFDKQVALNSCLLWIFSTPVLHYLFFWVTYDNPLNVCWAATIYFAMRYIKFRHMKDIYFIGICSGLLILSKYTGVILLISLFFFVILTPNYKSLLKNKHFYYSLLITMSIISPVIIWNYQYAWTSIFYQYSYQMNSHQYIISPWEAILRYFIKLLKHFDILFLLPIYANFKSYNSIIKNDSLLLLNYISIILIVFFMICSLKNSISKHLLTPLAISGAILSGYYFVKYNLRKTFILVISFYILSSIYYLAANVFFQKYFDEDFYSYSLIKSAGQQYLQSTVPIYTSDWLTAAKLSFWLPGQPSVGTLACGREHHYQYWKKDLKPMQNAIYFDFINDANCIKKSFNDCQLLGILTHKGSAIGLVKMPTVDLFAYFCKT